MPFTKSRMEVERVENMVINFGWKVVKQEILEHAIIVTIRKPIPPDGEIKPPPPE